jgi:hypothetical protein
MSNDGNWALLSDANVQNQISRDAHHPAEVHHVEPIVLELPGGAVGAFIILCPPPSQLLFLTPPSHIPTHLPPPTPPFPSLLVAEYASAVVEARHLWLVPPHVSTRPNRGGSGAAPPISSSAPAVGRVLRIPWRDIADLSAVTGRGRHIFKEPLASITQAITLTGGPASPLLPLTLWTYSHDTRLYGQMSRSREAAAIRSHLKRAAGAVVDENAADEENEDGGEERAWSGGGSGAAASSSSSSSSSSSAQMTGLAADRDIGRAARALHEVQSLSASGIAGGTAADADGSASDDATSAALRSCARTLDALADTLFAHRIVRRHFFRSQLLLQLLAAAEEAAGLLTQTAAAVARKRSQLGGAGGASTSSASAAAAAAAAALPASASASLGVDVFAGALPLQVARVIFLRSVASVLQCAAFDSEGLADRSVLGDPRPLGLTRLLALLAFDPRAALRPSLYMPLEASLRQRREEEERLRRTMEEAARPLDESVAGSSSCASASASSAPLVRVVRGAVRHRPQAGNDTAAVHRLTEVSGSFTFGCGPPSLRDLHCTSTPLPFNYARYDVGAIDVRAAIAEATASVSHLGLRAAQEAERRREENVAHRVREVEEARRRYVERHGDDEGFDGLATATTSPRGMVGGGSGGSAGTAGSPSAHAPSTSRFYHRPRTPELLGLSIVVQGQDDAAFLSPAAASSAAGTRRPHHLLGDDVVVPLRKGAEPVLDERPALAPRPANSSGGGGSTSSPSRTRAKSPLFRSVSQGGAGGETPVALTRFSSANEEEDADAGGGGGRALDGGVEDDDDDDDTVVSDGGGGLLFVSHARRLHGGASSNSHSHAHAHLAREALRLLGLSDRSISLLKEGHEAGAEFRDACVALMSEVSHIVHDRTRSGPVGATGGTSSFAHEAGGGGGGGGWRRGHGHSHGHGSANNGLGRFALSVRTGAEMSLLGRTIDLAPFHAAAYSGGGGRGPTSGAAASVSAFEGGTPGSTLRPSSASASAASAYTPYPNGTGVKDRTIRNALASVGAGARSRSSSLSSDASSVVVDGAHNHHRGAAPSALTATLSRTTARFGGEFDSSSASAWDPASASAGPSLAHPLHMPTSAFAGTSRARSVAEGLLELPHRTLVAYLTHVAAELRRMLHTAQMAKYGYVTFRSVAGAAVGGGADAGMGGRGGIVGTGEKARRERLRRAQLLGRGTGAVGEEEQASAAAVTAPTPPPSSSSSSSSSSNPYPWTTPSVVAAVGIAALPVAFGDGGVLTPIPQNDVVSALAASHDPARESGQGARWASAIRTRLGPLLGRTRQAQAQGLVPSLVPAPAPIASVAAAAVPALPSPEPGPLATPPLPPHDDSPTARLASPYSDTYRDAAWQLDQEQHRRFQAQQRREMARRDAAAAAAGGEGEERGEGETEEEVEEEMRRCAALRAAQEKYRDPVFAVRLLTHARLLHTLLGGAAGLGTGPSTTGAAAFGERVAATLRGQLRHFVRLPYLAALVHTEEPVFALALSVLGDLRVMLE